MKLAFLWHAWVPCCTALGPGLCFQTFFPQKVFKSGFSQPAGSKRVRPFVKFMNFFTFLSIKQFGLYLFGFQYNIVNLCFLKHCYWMNLEFFLVWPLIYCIMYWCCNEINNWMNEKILEFVCM